MNLFSLEFVILLSILLLLYYLLPRKTQWLCLLAASIVFYAFSGAVNLVFVGITSFTTWLAGILMSRFTQQFQREKKSADMTKEQRKKCKAILVRKKRMVLVATLLLNFGILSYFKYWETIYAGVVRALHPEKGVVSLGILLPLGISFYTFQAVGYLIDQIGRAHV